MKFLIALLFLITISGSAFAEDVPVTASEPTVITAPASDPGTAATQDEAVMPMDQATSDTPAESKKRTVFALTVGQYRPVNGEVKDIFGDGSLLRLGIRPLPTNAPNGLRFAFDVNWISLDSINGDADIIPITAGLLHRFGKKDLRSYAAMNVGPYYCDADVPFLGIDDKGWGWDVNFTLGTVFKERFCLEARYDLMDEFSGLDFSSISLSVAMRLFTAKI